MKLKLHKTTKTHQLPSSEQGFSLIETMIALTTLGVCLAYAMPLFLYAKINNSKSEIRTGALIVSQRVFDNIRSKSFKSMPKTDGATGSTAVAAVAASGSTPATPAIPANPELIPANINSPTTEDKVITKALGRQYQTKVTYCEGLTSDATICSDKYRKFKVEVSYNGSKVYDLEATYTEFEGSATTP
jgi:prepilin-type N-terminal cleavage/methylation domain-containing protein